MTGRSAAARSRRSRVGQRLVARRSTAPNGSGRPCSAMYRSAVRMISSEFASHASEVSPQAVMPCPPRTAPIASGWSRWMAAMSRPSWNPGRRHGTQATRSPKQARVSASPSAAVANAIPESGWRWSTCVGVDEAVHRGVDRRRGAAAAEQAVVERGDHLVLAVDARVDVDERAQPVEPQDRQAGLGQRPEIAAGALDPQQLDGRAGDRVDRRAFGRRVAARVVRVARVRAQPVATGSSERRDRARGPRRSCAPSCLVAADALRRDPLGVARIGRRPRIGSGSSPSRVRSSASSGRTSVS